MIISEKRGIGLLAMQWTAPMRVAFVDQSGDAIGGAEQSLSLLLRGLPQEVSPQIILFGDGAYARHLREHDFSVHVVAMPQTLLRTTREQSGGRGIMAIPAAVAMLARRIRELKVDVVYTNTIKSHLLAAPAARLSGIPCVAHLRDILHGRPRAVIRTVLQTCTTQRIAISGAVRDAFALPATAVIANPLDLSAYAALPTRSAARTTLGLPQNGLLVSLVGRINRWKGHDRFVRLATRAREGVRFAIVGAPIFRDKDFADELRREVRQRGLEERFSFVPWLEDPRVAYAASDVLCNCSDDEPFGRTLIEAAAAGVPAVCFAGGGTGEAVIHDQTGFIVPAGNEAAFAVALNKLLEDGALRARLGEAARIAARRFDSSLHAKSVMRVLRGQR